MKRLIAMVAVIALMAGMASAAPTMYGSNGLFRTISAKNAGPMNYGIGTYVYGWRYVVDSTAANPGTTTVMNMAIVPQGYFSINDMFELSVGTSYLMPSATYKLGTTETKSNPSGLGDSRVGLKFSMKAAENITLGLYGGYDIRTMADTFKATGGGYEYTGGIDARLLAGFGFGAANLDLNAGMYYDMDKTPDYATVDTTDSKSIYPNMYIPFSLGVCYDMGWVTPFVDLSMVYVMDTTAYPTYTTGTVKRGLMDNPMWAGAGLRFYVLNGLNITVGGEYNLLADSSANSPYFSDGEHWHAILGLHYAPKAEKGPKVPATGIIAGKVTDKNGKPLAATISVAGMTFNADPATGNYTAPGIQIGVAPVEVKADLKGYIAKTGSVVLTKKHKKTPATQDFVLDLKPIPQSDVSGKVIDYKTGNPVPATLTFVGKKTVTVKTDANGNYVTKLDPDNYKVTAAAEGYNVNNFGVTAADGKPVAVKNVGMVKVKEVFSFNNINFAVGKATITPEIETALQPLLKVMLDNPDLKVELGGHTDAVGSKVKNVKLSQARADAVMAWLIGKQVKAANMTAVGYGPNAPIATNKTKAGRAQNRRIEIKVVQ
ncbi:MAG: OmpA family protein [Candidatus Edwardsbacteria bacterium]|nr:OmpA family protein [Candidatus Edwardsbacteria bacterium]